MTRKDSPANAAPGIRADRLLGRLRDFAAIGATPGGGVNRQALTEGDRAARRLLAGLARERGFAVAQDAMANLFIRREGREPGRRPILIGSHLDTQPTGGRFDGALGVLAAFEVIEALEDDRVETALPVDVVAWTNEEGSRFAPGTMGSQAFQRGAVDPAWLTVAARDDGHLLADELAATLESLAVPRRLLGGPLSAYVELHIEQGPLLDRAGVPIGVVEGIQGVRWYEVELHGVPAHAGTTPPGFRHDALAAAVDAIATLQKELMGRDADVRFTVGQMSVRPGSVNAIPGGVTFSIDLRHPDTAQLAATARRVEEAVATAARNHGCGHEIRATQAMDPCTFPRAMLEAIRRAAEAQGLSTLSLSSGAFHDALFINRLAPTGMIFVPSKDGLSHNEAEYTADADVVAGAAALHAAVLDLAGRQDGAGASQPDAAHPAAVTQRPAPG